MVGLQAHNLSIPSKPFIIEGKNERDYISNAEELDKNGRFLRYTYTIIGIAKDLLDHISNFFSKFSHRKNYSASIQKNQEAKALCVLLHGLNGHPSIMDGHHDAFEKKLKNRVTIFQPFVNKKGNCSIEEASSHIHKEILNWAKENPKKPIVICGISNGARMASHLAYRLKAEGKIENPIKAECIAGPFYGTTLINQPSWPSTAQKVWRWIMKSPLGRRLSDQTIEELSWGSKRGKQLIAEMRVAAKDYGVSFDFFSSRADSKVMSFTSALPTDVHNSAHILFKNEGHTSIVSASRECSVARSLEFINSHR